MRTALPFLIAASLVVTPSPVCANGLLTIEATNSSLRFGLIEPYHLFYDISVRVEPDGGSAQDWFGGDSSGGDARSGPLVSQTLREVNGQVVWSTYTYRGGVLDMLLYLESRDRPPVTGSFVAPIRQLVVGAPNWAEGQQVGLDPVTYRLGRGKLDASLADAFGVGRRTRPGFIESWMMLVPPHVGVGGDHTTREREAWDGGSYIWVETTPVPEPALGILVALGLAVGSRWRRRSAS